MASLIWTEPALQDLDAIADYIALDKPEAAKNFIRHVFQRVEALRKFPKMGVTPKELSQWPYRQLIIPPCRIFYKKVKDKIYILHVMRAERFLDETRLHR